MYHRKYDCRPQEDVKVYAIPSPAGLQIVVRCDKCGARSATLLEPQAMVPAEQRAS